MIVSGIFKAGTKKVKEGVQYVLGTLLFVINDLQLNLSFKTGSV